ncbi:MAG: hypothetical protein PHU54_07215 [Candidatus Omnitrophica bacterium]|nr:hypothetical protein [Candidatus Omnitrophota bacterium]
MTAVYDSETVTWYTTTKDASVLLHELYDNMFVQLEYDWQTAHEWATIVEDAFNKSAELPTINSFRELVDLKLPAGADSAIYHLGDSRVFHIEYNSVDEKNSAMERMVFFVEQTPGQVLSDSELSRQHYSGAASDFRMSDVADFYNNAGADVLNSKEAALRDELMELGLLSKDESGKYVGASDIAIISTSQNLEGYFKEHYGFDMGPLREGCIAHELNHALYFTDSNYKERVAEQWNGVPANEQGAIKLFLQGCCDINVSNQDVLLREYAAYFRDPFVDAAGVKSQIDRIGNGETFASNHKSLQSSLKTELSAGRLSNQFLSENSKSLLALEKNTIFTANTGSGNTDGSVVKHADAGASNTNPHFGVEYTRDWLEKGHQLFDFKPFNEIELPDEETLPEISDFDPSGYFGLNGALFTYGNCKDENIQKGFDILKNTEWAESEEGRKIIPIIDSFVKDGRVATADLPGNVKSYSPYVSMGDFEPGYINTWPQPVDPTYLAYVYVDSDLTPEEIAGRLAYIGSERLYVTSGRTTDGSVTWNVGTYEKTISNAYENAYNVDSELNINGYNPTKAQILDTHEFPSDKYLEQAYKLVTNSQWAQTEVGRNVVPLLEKSHDEGKITFGGTTEMGGAGDCDGDGNIRLSGTDMYWAGQMVGTLAHEGTHLLGSEYFSGDWRTRCSEHDPDVDLQAYRDCQTLFDEKPSFQSEYDCEKEFISWAVMPSDEQIVSAYRLADFFAGLGSESGSGTQNKLYVTAAGTQPQTITEIGTFQQKAPFTADNANPATISIGKTISENRGLWSLVDIVTSSGAVTDVKIDSQEKGYQFSFNNQNNKAAQYQVQLFERNTDGTYDDNSKAVSSQVSAKPDGQGNVQGTVDFHKSGEYALKISPVNSDGSAKGPYSVVEFTANPLPPSEDSGAGEIEINKNFSFTYRFDIGKSATENVDRYEISVSNPDGTGTVKLTDILARDSHFTASIPAPMGLGYTFQEDVISQLENNNMLGKDVKVSVAAVDDRGRSSIPGEATLSMPSALRTITPAEIMQEKGEYFKENSVAYTTLADGVSSYEMVYGRVNPQDPVVQQFAEWLDFDTSSGLTYKGEDGKTYRFVIPYQDNIKGEYGMQNPAYTLVQNNGDCDDLSAAYASILDAKNIEGMETIVGGYSGYDFGHCQAEAYYQGKYYMIDNSLWQERTWTTNYDSFIWDDKIYSGDKAKVENWMGVIKPAAVSHDGWTQSEIAEFIDGAQGVKTTGKAALPTAEQQKTLETAAQTVVAPVYAELTGNTFDLDLTNVMIVTGTPLEEFTACVYEGYLWLNNAVFDNDSAFLADVLYHEEVESDILSGIVNPTEEDHKQAHLKAVQAEEGFEGYLVNIKTGDSAGSGSGEEASYQELNDVIRQIEQISEADLRICPPDSNTKYWGIYLFNSDQYDNAEINKQITGLLETVDCFWSERTGPSPIAYEYTIFPEISREELQCEIHPVEGTVVIVQGEWALTNAKDENPKLSTWGIATCQGVLVYNQNTQTGAAAHIDFSHEVSSTLETLIEAVGTGDNIKIWLTDNVDSMQVSVVEQRQDLEYEGILPRDFIFDTRNGEVTELSQGKSRELAGMEDSLTERNGIIDLRINNGITQCFRRYYKPADNG